MNNTIQTYKSTMRTFKPWQRKFNNVVDIVMIGLTLWSIYTFIAGEVTIWSVLSLAMGILGTLGNIAMSYGLNATFGFNMSNNVLGIFVTAYSGLYAETGMNIYYFLSQLGIGIKEFRGHKDTEGKLQTDGSWDKLKTTLLFLFATVVLGLISFILNGQMVFLDALQNGLAVIAQYLQMKRKTAGWLFWIISNLINIIVWLSIAEPNAILAITYGAYVANSIRGYVNFKALEA